MKKPRHNAILSIIEHQDIGTQEELLSVLLSMGFKVTQATVSRDIKELKLVKAHITSGQYRYTSVSTENDDQSEKFSSILKHSVIGVDYAGNMVVIKCYAGMAQATCAAIDALYEGGVVVGTLAGDDTVFVLCRSEDGALEFKNSITGAVG